ncbi:MAG: hypothetical protein ACREB8_03995, partial [Pseudolabrys sp.]
VENAVAGLCHGVPPKSSLRMIPRIEPEAMLIRKPVPIPNQVEDKLFGIMRVTMAVRSSPRKTRLATSC